MRSIAVGVLVDVLEEQDAALDARPVRRAEQRVEHRTGCRPTARPWPSRPSKPASVRKPTASSAPVIASRKQSRRDVVERLVGRPKSSHASGPGPGDAPRVGQQAELQRGQVAVADPAGAASTLRRELLPVDAVEQAREAVAAAGGQGDRGRLRGDAVNRGQPRVVVAGEALVLGAAPLSSIGHVEAERAPGAWRPAAAAPP